MAQGLVHIYIYIYIYMVTPPQKKETGAEFTGSSSEFSLFWGSEKDVKKGQFQGQLLWTFHALANSQKKGNIGKPDSLRER